MRPRWTRHEARAFVAGMRAGFRSILAIGGYRDEPPQRLDRQIGSPVSDSLARYRDMELFGVDVREASGERATDRRF
jgi:hypothetical protein